ncbi:hypothetical protein PEL8287_00213 [Roseovarius litorisediminis]|uniref:DUF2059 domain-containing protein n=1 Tax=Roseovarius litorisediminis TaxID=1312363 RepID=A0A1Y5R853_9RHOB|nr:DUF2059 domain-containing protein [Roseovarius litorisediminis]SLN11004.1 hypothetical protein PEL8287_00213 [Roseovarius litorisediminis]
MGAVSRGGLLGLGLAVMLAGPVMADQEKDLARLMEAMDFKETVSILQQEGLRYGTEVAIDMLPDADPDSWRLTVGRVYDTDRMYALLAEEFHDALRETDLTTLLDFYTSEGGQEVVTLELAARRAFLDRDIETAAQTRYEVMQGEGAPILDQIDRMIADSDLIEMNVVGALNSNLMFYRGLNDGGALDMAEDEMLSDVWAQEEDIRAESDRWLHGFLLMAYQPVESDLLEDYIALYRSPAGRDLNRALFQAFDRMYEQISYLLGQAVAQNMLSEKL